jgi:hypothetical protein
MGKALLSEAEFSRMVATRARRERPDIRIRVMGKSFLLVEPEPGRRRMVSLTDLYRTYCEAPMERDEVVGTFLSALVYQEPSPAVGTYAENQLRIMPQLVPATLLDFCRRDHRDLAAVSYVGGLAVAFVIDESERYAYIHRDVMEAWGVSEIDLLKISLSNLQALTDVSQPCHRIGTGSRLMLVWETFDGYDASRILLFPELWRASALVAGTPVVAVPHRDYMVMFGDADPAFVAEMQDRVREDFEAHSYPITPHLFTLTATGVAPYNEQTTRIWLPN